MMDDLGGVAGSAELGKLITWGTGTMVLIIFPPVTGLTEFSRR